MNRAQLDALLRAGLITAEQHTTALATITPAGVVAELPQLTVELAADDVEFSESSRTVTGIVTVYEQYIPSHHMVLHTGCMQPRQPLSRVKLLRDHNHADPIGYMTELDPETMIATFYIPEGENGDKALAEAQNGLRDGMSVGWTTLEYDIDDDWMIHIRAADFYETSLCALPAIADAGVINVAAALATSRKEHRIMNRAQLAAALADGKITQEQHDTALAAFEATEQLAGPKPAEHVAPEIAAGPELQALAPSGVTVHEPALSLEGVVRQMSGAAATGRLSDFQLALSNILPADDAGEAGTRPAWLGEVFTASDETRTWVNAIGQPEMMTKFKGEGWRWGDEPDVDEYDGDDATEVPSNDVNTEPVTFTGWGIAAGWGMPRQLIDFADEEFTRSFWQAVGRNYQRKTNVGTRTRVLAAAFAPGATLESAGGSASVATGDAVALIKQLIRDVRAIEGGRANRVFLGATQFGLLEDLPTDDLPLWLKSAEITLDITEGVAAAASGRLLITHDPALAANQGTAFDSRAMTLKEKAPLQLSAISVSHGKVDVGVFGYMRLDTHDPRLVIKRTAGEVLPTP